MNNLVNANIENWIDQIFVSIGKAVHDIEVIEHEC